LGFRDWSSGFGIQNSVFYVRGPKFEVEGLAWRRLFFKFRV
jgi:hypothetical protein